MKTIKNIIMFAIIGFTIFACDINSVDAIDEVDPSNSFQSPSTSFVLESDDQSYEVIVVSNAAVSYDRLVEIMVDDSSTGTVTDYNFTGNVVIPANELTGSTTLSFNYDAIAINTTKEVVLKINEANIISITYERPCVSNDVQLDITFDNYSNETSWDITDASTSAVVASGDGYGGQTMYSETINLPDGDYVFTIYDSYGDGICCTYGEGSYVLELSGCDTNLANGGTFGSQESTSFSIP